MKVEGISWFGRTPQLPVWLHLKLAMSLFPSESPCERETIPNGAYGRVVPGSTDQAFL